MNKNHQLKDVLKKTTKLIAGKDINVYTEGFQPRVEFDSETKKPTAIYIPDVPQNMPVKLIKAIQGYIDHECAHIEFSSYDDICDKEQSRLWHYVHNCIDDVRINKAMTKLYSGTGSNLKAAYDYLFYDYQPEGKGKNPYSKEFLDSIDLTDPEIRAKFYLNYASLWFAGNMDCAYNKEIFNELKINEFFEPLMKKMDSAQLEKLKNIQTQEDVREASTYFSNFFEENALEDSENKAKGEQKLKKIIEGLESLEDKIAKGIGSDIEFEITKYGSTGTYWTDRFDKTLDRNEICRNYNTAVKTVSSFEDETKSASNYIIKDLRRILEERQRRYYIGGYKSGKLNSKSLFSVAVGNDSIFKRKNEIREVNAAVSLLIDLSGSMNGSRVYVAMQSAYAFATVLQQLKIPFEVYGFNTDNLNSKMMREYDIFAKTIDKKTANKIINTGSPELIYAFKEFNENFDYLSKKAMTLASESTIPMIQNEDSKHVKLALERLSVRPEKVKSLFVFSDGQPCFHGNGSLSSSKLKSLCQDSLLNYGVTVYGIGIQSNSVERFYDNFVVVHNLNDLTGSLFKLLKKAI